MNTKELLESASVNFYWSRVPGKFVNKLTGAEYTAPGGGKIMFDGSVREWYETLVETIIDVSNNIQRRDNLRADFCIVSPDVATILECSVLYKPLFATGPEVNSFQRCPTCNQPSVKKVGSLNNRFVIYQDSSLPRNKVLVGVIGDLGPGVFGSVTVEDLFVEQA